MSFSLQPIANQAVGTVVAALFKRMQYKKMTSIPDSGQYVPSVYWYGGIPMTAKLQEAYQFVAEVTEHPSESGTPVSDHVILRPIRLELTFVVGNADGLGSNAQLARTALDEAIAVWESRQYFDLITTHRYLKNMVCLNLIPENQAPEWGALTFRATFQQVGLVDLQTAEYDPSNVQGAIAPATDQSSDEKLAASSPQGPPVGKSVTPAASPFTRTPTTAASRFDIFQPFQTPLTNQLFGVR